MTHATRALQLERASNNATSTQVRQQTQQAACKPSPAGQKVGHQLQRQLRQQQIFQRPQQWETPAQKYNYCREQACHLSRPGLPVMATLEHAPVLEPSLNNLDVSISNRLHRANRFAHIKQCSLPAAAHITKQQST